MSLYLECYQLIAVKYSTLTIYFLLLPLLVQHAFEVTAQDSSVGYLAAGSDTRALLQAYTQPLGEGLGAGMHYHWASGAKVHKTLGFDLEIGYTTLFVPREAETFLLQTGRYRQLSLSADQPTSLPTILGNNADETQLSHAQNGAFNVARGMGMRNWVGASMVHMPFVQGGIGIARGTDIRVKYMPSFKAGDIQFQGWGIGIHHDIKQYVPLLNEIPFNFSGLIAYNQAAGSKMLLHQEGFVQTEVGTLLMHNHAFSAQLMLSQQVFMLHAFATLGYLHGWQNVAYEGTYIFNEAETVSNPFSENYHHASSFLTLGARWDLPLLYFQGSYTMGPFTGINIGAGLRLR